MKKICAIIGPTASGKTRLAIEIAHRLKGEIISADSRQVYRYLDIGTAKPTGREQAAAKFHLIDIVDPDQNYSCGRFGRDAAAKIAAIAARGNRPIVCGGTGLYVKALFEPLHPLPESEEKIKNYLLAECDRQGVETLYKRLTQVDSAWAARINPRDKQRILRGLEVFYSSGRPLSVHLRRRRRVRDFSPVYFGLAISREELYRRIDRRFDLMIKRGLVEEVKMLLERGYHPGTSALRTIGYREIVQHLTGAMTLARAVEIAKQKSKNYAKRQITWFKKLDRVEWFEDEGEAPAKITGAIGDNR